MKYLKLLGFVIFFFLILFLLTKFYLPHFLSNKKPVESKNFLIEAWISFYEIEQAVKDYGHDPDSRFYIVGYLYPEFETKRVETNKADSLKKNNNNGIWLYANSSLGFSIPKDFNFHPEDSIRIIVTAKGQEAVNHFAYFNVIINGKCIGGAFTQTDYQEYTFDYIASEEGIITCYIKFNNDLKANTSDRNLNIKSIKIDNKFLIANKGNTIYGRALNNLTSGFGSQAEEVGNYLQKLGVDQKNITIINFEPVNRNQTLAAAERFNEFTDTYPLPAINVISSDIHSRRTWLTYQRIIGNQTNVGILYYHSMDYNKQNNNWRYLNLVSILHEYFAYLVNWILLTF